MTHITYRKNFVIINLKITPLKEKSVTKVVYKLSALRLIKHLVILMTFSALISCAGARSRVSAYTDPSFDCSKIKSVAILPMRNSQISYSDALIINRAIQQSLHRNRSDLILIGSEDSVNLINNKGLTEEYSKFLTSYYISGIPNVNTLKEIGKALNADVILQGGIINVHQSDGNGWDQKGGSNVTIKYGIISTDGAVIVWDATAECQAWTGSANEQAPSVMETVGPAINKIFSDFPLAKMGEILPQYKKETDNKMQSKGSK